MIVHTNRAERDGDQLARRDAQMERGGTTKAGRSLPCPRPGSRSTNHTWPGSTCRGARAHVGRSPARRYAASVHSRAPARRANGTGQPFVAPRVRPDTNCFCSMKKTMMGGRATITEPAESRL